MLFRTYGQAVLTLHERHSRRLLARRPPGKAVRHRPGNKKAFSCSSAILIALAEGRRGTDAAAQELGDRARGAALIQNNTPRKCHKSSGTT